MIRQVIVRMNWGSKRRPAPGLERFYGIALHWNLFVCSLDTNLDIEASTPAPEPNHLLIASYQFGYGVYGVNELKQYFI